MTPPPLRVCIVDDDDAVRDSLRILLESHGFDVHAFSSPSSFLRDAIAIAAHCLLFDFHMPEMTGLELAERIRALRMTTPVIIVSGRTDAVPVQRMERARVSAVLPKPVSDRDLLATIARVRTGECVSPAANKSVYG